MIPVTPQLAPAYFNAEVNVPGQLFLLTNNNPSRDDWKRNQFWRRCLKDLYAAYQGICAYSCFYIYPPSGSVDHYLPKSTSPGEAYNWNNYRLAASKINSNKGDNPVIDPFLVQPGWFVLDFPSCLVKPGDGLPANISQQVQDSIDILKLNSDDDLVQERCSLMVDFADGNVSYAFLARRYPFLATEITRQNLLATAGTVFRRLAPQNI